MNGPAETIRSFIALELSGQVREELARIIGILKGSGADVKWMKPGSIHLTLKFLGNIPPEKAHEISDRLKDIAVNARPYSLTLDGIGVFPGWGYARVIWVGIGEGSLETSRLAGEIDKAMVEEGFEKEKRAFSPHLTLGRIRRAKTPSLWTGNSTAARTGCTSNSSRKKPICGAPCCSIAARLWNTGPARSPSFGTP